MTRTREISQALIIASENTIGLLARLSLQDALKSSEGLTTEKLNAERCQYIMDSPVCGRTFDAYLQWLGLEVEDITGKRILDIGCGHSTFAAEAETYGADVTGIDPLLHEFAPDTPPDQRDQYEQRARAGKIVRGAAQAVHFPDASFDLAVSVISTPVYLPPYIEDRKQAVDEAVRVLRSGGQYRAYPVTSFGNSRLTVNDEMLKDVRAAGCSVEFDPVFEIGSVLRAGSIDRLIISKP